MHTISDIRSKIKSFSSRYFVEILVSIIIILVAVSSFYLGRMSVGSKPTKGDLGLQIEENTPKDAPSSSDSASLNQAGGPIVASKNGKRYYYKDCSGVGRISVANRIYFASAKEAESFGLTLASNCATK